MKNNKTKNLPNACVLFRTAWIFCQSCDWSTCRLGSFVLWMVTHQWNRSTVKNKPMIYLEKIPLDKKALTLSHVWNILILSCMTWSKMINFISNGHLSRFIRSRISTLKRTGNGKLTTILTRRRERLKWDPMDVQQSFFIVVTWGDLVLVGGEGEGEGSGTSCTLRRMTKYGHGKST